MTNQSDYRAGLEAAAKAVVDRAYPSDEIFVGSAVEAIRDVLVLQIMRPLFPWERDSSMPECKGKWVDARVQDITQEHTNDYQ